MFFNVGSEHWEGVQEGSHVRPQGPPLQGHLHQPQRVHFRPQYRRGIEER